MCFPTWAWASVDHTGRCSSAQQIEHSNITFPFPPFCFCIWSLFKRISQDRQDLWKSVGSKFTSQTTSEWPSFTSGTHMEQWIVLAMGPKRSKNLRKWSSRPPRLRAEGNYLVICHQGKEGWLWNRTSVLMDTGISLFFWSLFRFQGLLSIQITSPAQTLFLIL